MILTAEDDEEEDRGGRYSISVYGMYNRRDCQYVRGYRRRVGVPIYNCYVNRASFVPIYSNVYRVLRNRKTRKRRRF